MAARTSVRQGPEPIAGNPTISKSKERLAQKRGAIVRFDKDRVAGEDSLALGVQHGLVDEMDMQAIYRKEREKKAQIQEMKQFDTKTRSVEDQAQETKVNTFLQEKTNDSDLKHRQSVLQTMNQTGERQARGVTGANLRRSGSFDEEMGEAIADVQNQGGALKTTMDVLEDQLVVPKGFYARFQWAKAREIKRRARSDFVHANPRILKMVESLKFEGGVGIMMLMNGFTLAIGADTPTPPAWLDIAEHLFTAIFVLEAYCRIKAHGWPWAFEFYNMIDLGLVFVTGVLVMWILIPLGIQSEFIRNFQILRLLRLIKLVRAVKALPMLNLVWRMLRAFLVSGKILLWSVVDFIFLNFLFSIFFVVLVGHDDALIHDDTVADLFGNVSRGMITAMQVATLCHWSTIVRGIQERNVWVVPITLICIVVTNFVLLNIVTAVVIEQVFHLSKKDDDLVKRQAEQKRIQQWLQLRFIFEQMDEDGSGEVTSEELEEGLTKNFTLQRKLAEINMDKTEIQELWVILDTSGDGSLSIDEFLEGIRQMEGEASSYDMIRNNTRSKSLFKRLKKIGEYIHAITPEAKRLNIEVDRLHGKMAEVLDTVRPIEKKVLNIVKLVAEQMVLPTDENGMPIVDWAEEGGVDVLDF